tara:strand:+ start:440 stop:2380 length:1941 start_codon:yes stop_codon:yes gene_type:complete
MSENIDPNVVVAEAISNLAKASFEALGQGLTSRMRAIWSKAFEDFETYTTQTYRKNKNVRILCVKDRDIDLYEIYVRSKFSCSNSQCSDSDLIFKIRDGKNVVIYGNGGAGKTFFMRHLWLTMFENPWGVTPVFVDLRNLNELSTYDLKSFIRLTIVDKGLEEDLFDHFCEQGRFCFILDGFDEVLESARETLQGQILKLASRFAQCSFVLSSRPDKRFAGWSDFDVYASVPFDLAQVIELVDKVPFDERDKKLFKKKLDSKFFQANRSFLSNPLLSIMMMMTFRENMEIPKSMSIFYEQAFSTLYQWHDATKGYDRKKVMEIAQLKRSFGVFCLLSYYNQTYEFSASEIVSYIEKSNSVLGFNFDTREVLREYVESVNLMQQDGLNYVFIHRSFQEYFAAYALSAIFRDKCQVFSKILKGRQSDGFLRLAYEIDRDFILREFIFPEYNRVLKGVASRRLSKKRFQSIVSAEISYVIELVADANLLSTKKMTRLHIRSLGIEKQSEVRQFLNMLQRLQDVFSDEAPNIEFEDGFVRMVFEKMQDVLGRISFPADRLYVTNKEKCAILLSFSDSDFSVSLRAVGGEAGELEALRLAIDTVLRDEIEVMVGMADKIREQIDVAKTWCEKCIIESENRERSLDEVLNLA